MDDNVEKEISCDVTLKVIDMILLNETSLNKPTVRKRSLIFRCLEWQTDCLIRQFYFPFSTAQTFSGLLYDEKQKAASEEATRVGTISNDQPWVSIICLARVIGR